MCLIDLFGSFGVLMINYVYMGLSIYFVPIQTAKLLKNSTLPKGIMAITALTFCLFLLLELVFVITLHLIEHNLSFINGVKVVKCPSLGMRSFEKTVRWLEAPQVLPELRHAGGFLKAEQCTALRTHARHEAISRTCLALDRVRKTLSRGWKTSNNYDHSKKS